MGKDLKGKELGVGLCQRKDGRYSARYTTSIGSRREKNFIKVSDARAWLSEQKYLDKAITSGDMTVDTWYKFWITTYKKDIVAANTYKNYSTRYRLNIKGAIGNMLLSDVKQFHCQKILSDMFDSKKYSNGTMEQTLITMHAIFRGAVDNDYLLKNPADGLRIKKHNVKVQRRVLSREEQREFINHARGTLYSNVFELALQTGLRAGELGGLQWKYVDLERKVLFVQHTLLQDPAKGGFYLGEPKTEDSKREVPLTDEAIRILREQAILQKKSKLKSKQWDSAWENLVFTTKNGKPVGASTLRLAMVRIINNINVDRKINDGVNYVKFEHAYMHALRHTFATRCIENGMQPKALQAILGHSTISITMDTYVHVIDDHRFQEMEKMNVAI